MSQIDLPFEVGDTIEARSFELGFRGAWFRCKITKIFNKGRALFYDLENTHNKVYQKRQGESENILMVRPIRPRQSHENEEGCGGEEEEEEEEEEVVVVRGLWKVGDLVDWWKDDCYWSGTVLEVNEEDETAKYIELVPEPYGEGKSYDAMFKDLVPSLEWSLEDGWIVPFSKDGEKRQCAKLMKLPNEGAEETREEEKQRPTKKKAETHKEVSRRPRSCVEYHGIRVYRSCCDDLEEQIVRIEWIKGMLLLNSDNSTWIYEDYPPPSS
ncbi:hypothetical protein HID58_093439 [Brassica napus]|uniref:Agenet domain-containing protein n=1 Tax=Brassica napus TaxID=3708 RepID=A0ABQ7XAY9_BRANA|nr:hypothetical protein HID58_093439 [Brassica napus]